MSILCRCACPTCCDSTTLKYLLVFSLGYQKVTISKHSTKLTKGHRSVVCSVVPLFVLRQYMCTSLCVSWAPFAISNMVHSNTLRCPFVSNKSATSIVRMMMHDVPNGTTKRPFPEKCIYSLTESFATSY